MKYDDAIAVFAPFQPSNLVPIENKIHLSQSALGSGPNRELLHAQFYCLGILYERLPPDLDECLLEGQFHHRPSQWVDYMSIRDGHYVCGRTAVLLFLGSAAFVKYPPKDK
jgi:hypothetical protein